MNLIIDKGNSFTKIFVFDKDNLIHNQQLKNLSPTHVKKIISIFPELNNCIISSVSEIKPEIIQQLKESFPKLIVLDETTSLPIQNDYQTPETLGKDRIAAVVGAYNIFPHTNVLVIDAGTAITFDFINSSGTYKGGNISPGMAMRYKALHKFTARLPWLEAKEQNVLIGKNTHEAIIAGVQNGIIFEIDTYINRLLEQYNDLKVILTGGDTFFFAHKLKNTIFAKPFLVAIGLNRILIDNVKKY